MERTIIVELCQRLRGLRAAQKNLHYTFESYGDHLMTDRFAEGEANGFNCNSFIDEIQECVAMYDGPSVDEVEIDSYPEDFSIALTQIESREQAFGVVSDLFKGIIDLINSTEMDTSTANLAGNIAQAAARAKAFYDRLKGKSNESTDKRLASTNPEGSNTVA